ncbi:2-hydroxychromene-2-carboxylate isomerase [Phaeobacter sp. CNT1-3]|nr:2-hydroxychromene-2-carboxylate isomerase [Phaeobacter sp. CNT1-3]
MTVTVDYLYDFGSPNSYFCHKVIPDIEARTGVSINYIPCLLGGIFNATGNMAPAFAFGKVKGKMEYERLEIARFVKRHNLTDYQFNTHFPVNTLLMMRAAVAAQQLGVHEQYMAAGWAAMWEKSLKMDDPQVFVQAMDDAGLDGAQLLELTQTPEVKEGLKANTTAAVERGAFGMPCFFVGDEMYFGKERLTQVEEEIVAQLAAAG